MKNNYLILIIFLYAPYTYANFFQTLYQGFKQSESAQELELSREIVKEDAVINLGKNSLKLDLAFTYGDSALDNLFEFQANRTISESYKIGLSKSTFRYGTFSFEHEQIVNDISNWNSFGLSAAIDINDPQYETKNTIEYTYEILNEFSRIEEKEIKAQAKYDNITQEIADHKAHYDFFVAYMNTKMRILVNRFYNESKNKAQKRVRTVRKRSKDGLSRKVDLDSARISVLTQDETILQNEAELRLNIATLEDLLGQKIGKDKYKTLEWTFKKAPSSLTSKTKSKFPEVEQLKFLNDISNLNLVKLKASSSQSLALSLRYRANSVTNRRDDAFSDSISGLTDEKIVSLQYSIPLGLKKNSALKRKKKLEAKRNELRLKNKTSELTVMETVLTENIQIYTKALEIINKKLSLMKRIVRENEKLYWRGQVTFEEVLRSEETLITTKIARVNMYALYEGALAQKAFLKGDILNFLKGYID